MKFLWPHGLWLLAAVPLFAALYAWRTRQARRTWGAMSLLIDAGPRGSGRYLPGFAVALGLSVLAAASARPAVLVERPTARPTVILAIDTSGSMQADDVVPTRIGAAQAAAREFARGLPEGARLGIVRFTDGAEVVHAPSVDREAALRAIDSLQPQMGTAIGYGILVSLRALFPEERIELREEGASAGGGAPPGAVATDRSVAIVLLTDGQNTEGPAPLGAALLAAQHGVRIYTVGIGTPGGSVYRGVSTATPVGIDEGSLLMIASLTRAEYFYASSAPDLKEIYSELGSKLVLEKTPLETTALFCALGAIMLVAGASLSLLRSGRIV